MANDCNIDLTQSAVQHVIEQLQSRGQGVGIRIAVKKTGCSGLAYVMEYVDQDLLISPCRCYVSGDQKLDLISICVLWKSTAYFVYDLFDRNISTPQG